MILQETQRVAGEALREGDVLTPYVPPIRQQQRPLSLAPEGRGDNDGSPPEAAGDFRQADKDRMQRQWAKYYSSLTWDAKCVLWAASVFQFVVTKPLGRTINWLHKNSSWLQFNAWKVSKFVRTHMLLITAPWTTWARRKSCRDCDYRRGEWCEPRNKSCNCGTWRGSKIVHVTRLSDIDCPKGYWGKGFTAKAWHGAWKWYKEFTGTTTEASDGK